MEKKMVDKEFLEKNEDKRTKCECWTRAMGFIRPVSFFNIGKKSEFKERKFFTEKKIAEHLKNDKK